MPAIIFDFISPVHPKWNALLDEQHYIKLEDTLNELSSLLKESHLLDVDKASENLPFYCSFKFSDDDEVRIMNRDFRGKDKPTNVLSFPQGEKDENDEGEEIFYLGDIILAYETILRESTQQSKDFHDHLLHLCLHGVLHLLGHDHIEDKEAQAMERLEIEMLNKCGIQNPYDV